MDASLVKEVEKRCRDELSGNVMFDRFSRGRYATDASIYQMMPLGVVLPESADDVNTVLEIARDLNVPVLPRGGGTSQCGQTVNNALVIDYSRHLNAVLELDVENRTCVVQPGIVLDELNRFLKPHGLWFPVDVSTASRATIGGMTANNSCGQRSIRYGTMRHNVMAIDALLADGTRHLFDASPLVAQSTAVPSVLKQVTALAQQHSAEIHRRYPQVLRRVGGYNLDALVQQDQKAIDYSDLLVGSEGTLACSLAITLKLSPLPTNKVLGVCHFPTFFAAMDATQHLVRLDPTGVELVDSTMIALGREIALYRPTVEQFVRGNPGALLLVEFAEDDQQENLRRLDLLEVCMGDLGFTWAGSGEAWGGVLPVVEKPLQAAIGEVRKAGLNIMMSMKSEGKPVSFVEDCAVELPDLAEYTARLTEVFEKHGTQGTWYAHASVGCLHVRPVLNMKLEKDAMTMRAIADEAFDLVLEYKGSHSGEHGDGIARSEFHRKMFGDQIVQAFAETKRLFDPLNLLNPGKIVDPPAMNDRTLFRFQPEYTMDGLTSRLDWSAWAGAGGGFQGAVEMCNNNGACRKLQGGVMCPSYRATRNERDVTRGRANTLRLALSGQLGKDAIYSPEMADTLRFCVSCKACKRECPTGVDMARMKLEVLAARGEKLGYSLHDRIVARLPQYAPLAARFAGIANLRNRWPWLSSVLEKPTGFDRNRPLPNWRRDFFREPDTHGEGNQTAVLFADTFNTYFEPENLLAAHQLLVAAGYRVITAGPSIRQNPVCCGRTWLAAGMIDQARKVAMNTIARLLPLVRQGACIVGLEPSCLLTLKDEYLALLPREDAREVAEKSMLLEEFVMRETQAGRFRVSFKPVSRKVKVHGHCHQKAFEGMGAVEQVLGLIPELDVEVIDSGCCGMAGSFGYAKETADVSSKMAELDLLPAVRSASADTLILADGTSCRHQIELGAGVAAQHVVTLLASAVDNGMPDAGS